MLMRSWYQTQQSRHLLRQVKLVDARQLVETLCIRARLSITPLHYYNGDDVDEKGHMYEPYISAEKQGLHAAFQLIIVLAIV